MKLLKKDPKYRFPMEAKKKKDMMKKGYWQEEYNWFEYGYDHCEPGDVEPDCKSPFTASKNLTKILKNCFFQKLKKFVFQKLKKKDFQKLKKNFFI